MNFSNFLKYAVFMFLCCNISNAQKNKSDITQQTFDNIEFKETLYSKNVTDYLKLPNEFAKTYGSFSYESLVLDRQIAEEIRLLISLKYNCNYCVIFHTEDLKKTGLDPNKIATLTVYNESDLFSNKEKSALNLAIAVSDVDYSSLPNALANAKQYFKDEEIENIISCTLLMDIWARVFAIKGKTPYYVK